MLQIAVDVAIFAIAALIGFVLCKYAIPYLKDHHLVQVAKIVVRAAEAIIGEGNGKEKFDYAVKQIEEKYHIHVNLDQIKNAVESAWLELDTEQRQNGTKAEDYE